MSLHTRVSFLVLTCFFFKLFNDIIDRRFKISRVIAHWIYPALADWQWLDICLIHDFQLRLNTMFHNIIGIKRQFSFGCFSLFFFSSCIKLLLLSKFNSGFRISTSWDKTSTLQYIYLLIRIFLWVCGVKHRSTRLHLRDCSEGILCDHLILV